jgi:hypothetical protein
MNNVAPLRFSAQPYFAWQMMAWKTMEMAIAASKVIGMRTSRIALAGHSPSASDQREVVSMVQEKGQAAMESSQAITVRLLALNQQFAALAFRQMLSASRAMMSIAGARSASDSLSQQTKLLRDTLQGSVDTASKLSTSTAKIARSALKPVHKRVRSNAKRLGKTAR